MKRSHIILIIVIAVAVGAVVSLMSDTRTYADFETASKHPDINYEIVGTLDTSVNVTYDPKVNSDEFTFFMMDDKGNRSKVICLMAKPQDFEKSTQVVVSGNMKDDAFYADNVLLKCPSKYEEEGIVNYGQGN